MRADGRREAGVPVALVETLCELEDRRPGLRVARDHGVLHGRGAPPPGQQREVQVDPAEPGPRQQRLAHERAIRDDDAQVDLERQQCGLDLTEPTGFEHRQTEAAGLVGDGCRGQHAFSPLGGRRAGDDAHDLVLARRERCQRGHGSQRAAGDDETQRGHATIQPDARHAPDRGGAVSAESGVSRSVAHPDRRRARCRRSARAAPARGGEAVPRRPA